MIERHETRKVMVGDVPIGGGAAIPVQSMTTTKTHDIKATLKEVDRLEAADCQIIRITVPDEKAAKALPEIKKHMTVPLVADIHFNYRMALEAGKMTSVVVRFYFIEFHFFVLVPERFAGSLLKAERK